MKPITFKERIVFLIVGFIEWIINNKRLIKPFKFLSEKLKRFILAENNPLSKLKSPFEGLSVAFICDGNRRWMRQQIAGKKDVSDEVKADLKLRRGSEKIGEIAQFAYYHKFKEVSFFCFSIKNFRRADKEVNEIMDFVKKNKTLETTLDFRFKIYGCLDLLDPEVKEALLDVELKTKDNKGLVVNVFFSYNSSEDEKNGNKRFKNHVDLLVRTSGERRLSDFMVRNVATGTSVEFIKPLWPEFTFIHLYLILLKHILENRFIMK